MRRGRGRVNPQELHRHDLKNQLSIILGFSDLLLTETKPDDPRRGELEEIHRAATEALALVARAFPVDASSP